VEAAVEAAAPQILGRKAAKRLAIHQIRGSPIWRSTQEFWIPGRGRMKAQAAVHLRTSFKAVVRRNREIPRGLARVTAKELGAATRAASMEPGTAAAEAPSRVKERAVAAAEPGMETAETNPKAAEVEAAIQPQASRTGSRTVASSS
jgi:hypothetical protein